MYPVLFQLGAFQFRSFTILTLFAWIAGGFVFWRKGREEHYSEIQIMDGFLLSMLVGFISSRFVYIALNFEKFGWNLVSWIDIVSNSGTIPIVSLLVSTLFLARFSYKKKWDVFEVLDFWTLATCVGYVFRYLGYFLEGSLFGRQTSLPWGMVFPGVFEKVHPVQLYFVVFYIVLAWYLSWVEYRYRTFEWFRFGKKTAKTGFLISVFIVATSFFSLLVTWVQIPELVLFGNVFDRWLYLAGSVVGLYLLFVRSGRSLLVRKKELKNPLEELIDRKPE